MTPSTFYHTTKDYLSGNFSTDPNFNKKQFVKKQVKHHMGETVKVIDFYEDGDFYAVTVENRKGQIMDLGIDIETGEIWH